MNYKIGDLVIVNQPLAREEYGYMGLVVDRITVVNSDSQIYRLGVGNACWALPIYIIDYATPLLKELF